MRAEAPGHSDSGFAIACRYRRTAGEDLALHGYKVAVREHLNALTALSIGLGTICRPREEQRTYLPRGSTGDAALSAQDSLTGVLGRAILAAA